MEPSSVSLGLEDVIVSIKVIRNDVMPLQRFNITLMEVVRQLERGRILLPTLHIVIAGQKGGYGTLIIPLQHKTQ